jgi:hypothetical protein
MYRRVKVKESEMEVIASLVEPPMELLLAPEAEAPKRPRASKRPSPVEAGEPAKRQRAEDGTLIIAKAVREYLKGLPNPVNCSAEALAMINTRLQRLLLEAAGRTYDNGRKTLKASDL